MAFVKLSKSPSNLIPCLPYSIPPIAGLRRSGDWYIPHPSKDFLFGEWNVNGYSHNGGARNEAFPVERSPFPRGGRASSAVLLPFPALLRRGEWGTLPG